jgi:DhnA family fructose-bisphosphate aldolase class Ia
LVRGGGRVPDDELFRRTQVVLEQGAAGIVYGRNVIQHQNPAGLTRALMAMLHDGADATKASEILAAS